MPQSLQPYISNWQPSSPLHPANITTTRPCCRHGLLYCSLQYERAVCICSRGGRDMDQPVHRKHKAYQLVHLRYHLMQLGPFWVYKSPSPLFHLLSLMLVLTLFLTLSPSFSLSLNLLNHSSQQLVGINLLNWKRMETQGQMRFVSN